jgi:glutaredoxin 3
MKLFIKEGCPWCEEAEAWLSDNNFEYERIDVLSDHIAFSEMKRISGQTKAPTLQLDDGQVLADFDVDELEDFFRHQGLIEK